MITFEERRSLLTKPNLSAKEIMILEDCREQKARKIMKLCKIGFNGSVPGDIHRIKTISYLKFSGADEDYLKKLFEVKDYGSTYIG